MTGLWAGLDCVESMSLVIIEYDDCVDTSSPRGMMSGRTVLVVGQGVGLTCLLDVGRIVSRGGGEAGLLLLVLVPVDPP